MSDTDALPARHKLDADAYYRMAEAGILARHERVELINGEILDMAPIGHDHETAVNRLTRALVMAFGDNALVSVQNPLRLDPSNVPQPDFVVLRPRADDYAGSPPGPADVLLLIEVADSSLRYDSTSKLALYAQAGIAEYWIVNLRRRVLQTYGQPGPAGYASGAEHGPTGAAVPALAPGVRIALNRILG